MNKQEIRNHILKTLWDSWDRNKHIGLYHGVFSQQAFDEFEDTIIEVVEELKSKGLFNDNYGGELTGRGIIYAEEQNVANPERLLYHQNLRHKILSFLFELGYSECIHLTKLADELNSGINEVGEEHHLLYQLGLVKSHDPSISREGIDYWNEYLRLESFKTEF